LLAQGSAQRRARQRRAARETLERALATFEELGAALWAGKARAEVGRIGGRAPAGDGLTPSEPRIAELVAEGKTNREVAGILVVADRTVESAFDPDLPQARRPLADRARPQAGFGRLSEDRATRRARAGGETRRCREMACDLETDERGPSGSNERSQDACARGLSERFSR
jgi:Bacterial regulatory proteins, luxR family